MINFALIEINSIEGEQIFWKLAINNKCQFDEYALEIKKTGTYVKELGMIYKYMELIANLKSLPEKRFKDITPEKEKVKEYEFKSKHLSVYAIKKENGKIIILGGYKNRQKNEIRKFKAIKKLYLEYLI